MAAMLFATPGPDFVGHSSVFQFVNADGPAAGADPETVCGQAAIATVLANRHRIPQTIEGFKEIEKRFPANIASGALGTTPGLIVRALDFYHLGYRYEIGRVGLEKALRQKKVAIALIQNTSGISNISDGAHWFVVFGCDRNGVHVTNYRLPSLVAWSKFEDMWSGTIPTVAMMGERAIIC